MSRFPIGTLAEHDGEPRIRRADGWHYFEGGEESEVTAHGKLDTEQEVDDYAQMWYENFRLPEATSIPLGAQVTAKYLSTPLSLICVAESKVFVDLDQAAAYDGHGEDTAELYHVSELTNIQTLAYALDPVPMSEPEALGSRVLDRDGDESTKVGPDLWIRGNVAHGNEVTLLSWSEISEYAPLTLLDNAS